MSDPLAQIDQISQAARDELGIVRNAAELEQFRIKYLGSNGLVKGMSRLIGQATKEQKPVVGQRVNEAKGQLEASFNALKQQLAQDATA